GRARRVALARGLGSATWNESDSTALVGRLPVFPPRIRSRPGSVATGASDSGVGRRAATFADPSEWIATTERIGLLLASSPPATYMVPFRVPADACIRGVGMVPIFEMPPSAGVKR